MKVLITAGPTHEAIDPVRFIANKSSGKMGYALAHAFYSMGHSVVLISGPVHIPLPDPGIQLVSVVSAGDMYQATMEQLGYDIAVMAAAVADYRPKKVWDSKMKKSLQEGETLHLELEKTEDILASLGEQKQKHQVLIGFALESDLGLEAARQKLLRKNADAIVLNSLQDEGAGFGHDTNVVTLLMGKGLAEKLPLMHKTLLAKVLAQKACQIWMDKQSGASIGY